MRTNGTTKDPAIGSTARLKVVIRGAVQGVGFRPFVYRLAAEIGVHGWVSNTTNGVFIEAEAPKESLDRFLLRLQSEKPPRASIQSMESSFLDPVGFVSFEIRKSDDTGAKTVLILPDIATCPDCLKDVFDPANRRHLYPFTNCTNCGPRFTIIEALPYDRPNTSMNRFTMCADCQREYEDPLDRRFHAQPNACPTCGPHLELWDLDGYTLASDDEAMLKTCQAIREGRIAAVKGLGGFHLLVDARSEEAVQRLRARKHREEKPLALMCPDIELVKEHCEISELEERLLLSPESPIVLLTRRGNGSRSEKSEVRSQKPEVGIQNSKFIIHNSLVAPSVAPRNPYLGIMLPYTPLHHILMHELGFPVVATSGNLSDEPICTDEFEALTRLRGIADVFLVHNRHIVRHTDDSIVRVMAERESVLRRARGYAPLPIVLKTPSSEHPISSIQSVPLLAVGAHLKNTVAITSGANVFVSQHIGDLETSESLTAFGKVIDDFQRLYEVRPETVVCDMHPDYLSTKHARACGILTEEAQHHYAHVASCMAENELDGAVLGVAWDGTGYGLDGTIWGGEFLLTTEAGFERAATFRPFKLPGGEKAIKEPRRAALGVLYEVFGEQLFKRRTLLPLKEFSGSEISLLHQMLTKGINAPTTTSAGRLFDAVASIIGLRHYVRFEGHAAMELEFACAEARTDARCEFSIEQPESNRKSQIENRKSLLEVDWRPIIVEIVGDVQRGVKTSLISAKFHNTLVEVIVQVAKQIGQQRIVLTGGCFQNKYLTERTVRRLRQEGFHPYWHQRVPPNDGGISLGQAYAFIRKNRNQAFMQSQSIEEGAAE
jgi:hydrogenase maturation protein HypF